MVHPSFSYDIGEELVEFKDFRNAKLFSVANEICSSNPKMRASRHVEQNKKKKREHNLLDLNAKQVLRWAFLVCFHTI